MDYKRNVPVLFIALKRSTAVQRKRNAKFLLSCTVDHSMSPFDLVRLLWPDSLCELIAKETNMYATENRKIRKWTNVTTEEVWAFLGIIVVMGIHRLPEIDNYWSSDPLLGVESVKKCMSRNRFWAIRGNIHLVD